MAKDHVRIDVDINESAIPQFKQDFHEALTKAMTYLVTKAKRRAPVDTGTFMRSIDKKVVDYNKALLGSSDKPGKVWALEHGHSEQAPAGVFIPTIKANEKQVRKIFEDTIG